MSNNNTSAPTPTLDPAIWGPHFWFFIHTISLSYPHYPNDVTKKKYYDFIVNLPAFIPNEQIGKNFEKLLDQYPVSPYLDNRESLVKWSHFIHNKINELLEKPKITLEEFYIKYYEEYKPKNLKLKEYYRWRQKILYTLVILSATGLVVYLYKL
jgi:hypothetical protein